MKRECNGNMVVYLIWLILAVLAIINKKNAVVTALLFVFILLVFWGNTASPDLEPYRQHYYRYGPQPAIHEPLYLFFETLFINAGLSYEVFRGVFVVFGLLFVTRAFYKLSPYPTLALLLYSIYPMCIDVVQLRFTTGYAIVFYFSLFLIDYQRTHDLKYILLFLVGIALAAGFHYSCLFYLIMGVVVFDSGRHRNFFLYLVPVALVFLMIGIDRFSSMTSNIVGENKADTWMATMRYVPVRAKIRILVSRSLPVIASLFLARISISKEYDAVIGENTGCLGLSYDQCNFMEEEKLQEHPYFDIRVNRCLFLWVFYSFFFSILEVNIRGDYERLSRYGLLVSVLLATRQIEYLRENNRHLATALYILIYIAYFCGVIFFMTSGSGETYFTFVFRQVMENNSIFAVLGI